MKSETFFLKHLDNPKMLMGMAMNDLLCLGLPLYLGICLKKMLIFSIFGLSLFLFRRKVSRTLPRYYLVGMAYWFLPTKIFNNALKLTLPPSSKRFYLR